MSILNFNYLFIEIMKKLVVLTLLMLSLWVVLTWCTSKTDTSDDAVVVEDTNATVADRNEYQFIMKTKWSDGLDSEIKMYKKDGNSLVEFVKISALDGAEMPFTMKKILSVWNKTYELIEKNWEEYRFVVPGMNATDDMFNLKDMSTIDESIVKETKNEKIDGERMICYYMEDTQEGKWKWCMYDGIYRYGEYTQDGVKHTIIIEDYDDDVSDKIFKIPSEWDIHAMQDMMKLMQ